MESLSALAFDPTLGLDKVLIEVLGEVDLAVQRRHLLLEFNSLLFGHLLMSLAQSF